MPPRKRVHCRSAASLLISVALPLGWLGGCGRESTPPEPPSPPTEYNVVLISLDTLRADGLNCYGYTKHTVSPSIDALAADGILFETTISSSSWTTPAHMSLFTSLVPTAHGVTQSLTELEWRMESGARFNMLPEHQITLAEELRRLGCATAAFTGGGPMHPGIGFGQGFDVYETNQFKLNDSNTAAMFRWLDEHRPGPFFLFWHTFEVHGPYLKADFIDEFLSPDQARKFREALRPFEQYFDAGSPRVSEMKSIHQQFIKLLTDHGAYNRNVCAALYAGGVMSADRWIGRLIDYLRRHDLYDRTIIVLTSDHGEELADRHPTGFYNDHGHTLYGEIVRVPLIIKLPQQRRAGTRVSTMVRLIDIMPTLFDVLEREPMNRQMQGRSLRAVWREPDGADAPIAISEGVLQPWGQKSARSERYKLICTIDADSVREHGRAYLPDELARRELYDLDADAGERTNLLEAPDQDAALEIAATLEHYLRRTLARRRGQAATTELDQETLDALRALGYVR